jgi:hypothetical protein
VTCCIAVGVPDAFKSTLDMELGDSITLALTVAFGDSMTLVLTVAFVVSPKPLLKLPP